MHTFLLLLQLTLPRLHSDPAPVSIIFDTDIASDYDDVGALAILHAFADMGEARILATISSNPFETTVPTLSVINTYFRRADVPIGVLKAPRPIDPCPRLWAQGIISRYPHGVRSNDEAADAVSLYRKTLSSQPDSSVTIVTVGYLTNLANLLDSSPDAFSPHDGTRLVAQKVRRLVSMAGRIDSSTTGGYEYNMMKDPAASRRVLADWPTPMTLSGFEVGAEIFTGIRLINNDSIQHSPVKDAYHISLTYDSSAIGRPSWDQTAVLVAVRGIEPYFGYRRLGLAVLDDGRDSVFAADRITYLTARNSPSEIGRVIEDLMMHQPRK